MGRRVSCGRTNRGSCPYVLYKRKGQQDTCIFTELKRSFSTGDFSESLRVYRRIHDDKNRGDIARANRIICRNWLRIDRAIKSELILIVAMSHERHLLEGFIDLIMTDSDPPCRDHIIARDDISGYLAKCCRDNVDVNLDIVRLLWEYYQDRLECSRGCCWDFQFQLDRNDLLMEIIELLKLRESQIGPMAEFVKLIMPGGAPAPLYMISCLCREAFYTPRELLTRGYSMRNIQFEYLGKIIRAYARSVRCLSDVIALVDCLLDDQVNIEELTALYACAFVLVNWEGILQEDILKYIIDIGVKITCSREYFMRNICGMPLVENPELDSFLSGIVRD